MRKKGIGWMFLPIAVIAFIGCHGITLADDLEPMAATGTSTAKVCLPPAWSLKLDASTRFDTVLGGEAVLDRETGLVWGIGASSFHFSWAEAQRVCNQEAAWGWRFGWRLPTLQELASLIDILTNTDPALPNGHPFAYYGECNYWSSTSYAGDDSKAWYVDFCYPRPGYADRSSGFHLWCVRGGQGVE